MKRRDHSLLVSTPSPGGGQDVESAEHLRQRPGQHRPCVKASQMALGKSYSLTATPAKGWVFRVGPPSGCPAESILARQCLSFNFVSNTVITANFIPNPFGALQGNYNGLFSSQPASIPAVQARSASSCLQPALFRADCSWGPNTYNFSSQFSGAGSAQVLARSGAHTVTLNLQLDMTGQSGQILGDVQQRLVGCAFDRQISRRSGRPRMLRPWRAATRWCCLGEQAVATVMPRGASANWVC
jgi:hypothetical protein